MWVIGETSRGSQLPQSRHRYANVSIPGRVPGRRREVIQRASGGRRAIRSVARFTRAPGVLLEVQVGWTQ
jgi:hypothetical protein